MVAKCGSAQFRQKSLKRYQSAHRLASESGQANRPKSASKSAAFHEIILAKLEQGLTAEAIHRYLVEEHQFSQKYHSVRRYIAKLGKVNQLPYRRVETEPGEQMQIDFGTGAPCLDRDGKQRRTYVFRAVLSHSRKGYSEAVKGMNVENFLTVLEKRVHCSRWCAQNRAL